MNRATNTSISGSPHTDQGKRRLRSRLVLMIVVAVAGIWICADLVHSRWVAHRVGKWESNVQRDDDGIVRGCAAYSVGAGDTALLLIHGINSSPRCYEMMAESLAEANFRCRVMRLPGFAEPLQQYASATMDQWVNSVGKEIEQLRSEHAQVVIIAHSLGGAVAIGHLLDHPDMVMGVVLLAPAVAVADRRSPIFPVRTWHRLGRHTILFSSVLWSPFASDCHDPEQREYAGRSPYTPRSVIDELFKLMDQNLHRAAELTTPMLMVLSKEDRVVDWQQAERYFERSGSAIKEIVFVNRSGHEIPRDYDWPQVVTEIVRFVDDLSTPTTAAEGAQ